MSTQFEPLFQMTFVLCQIRRGETHLLEPEFASPAPDT